MLRKVVSFSVLVFVIISVNAQKSTFRLVEVGHLGELEGDKEEYIFGLPIAATIDEENNLYVADASRNAVLVYNSLGNYVRIIGGRGDAPGEFGEITAMFLDGSSLVVIDRLRQRVTNFSLEGRLQSTKVLDLNYQVWPSRALQLDSNSYLIVAPLMTSEYEPMNEYGLMHVYDSEFEKPIATVAQADQFYDILDDYSQARIITGGDMNVYSNTPSSVLAVKNAYDATYYYFKQQNNRWVVSQFISKELESKAYNLIEVDRSALASGGFNKRVTKIMNGPKGLFAVDELTKSFLLLGTADGRKVVHVYGSRVNSINWNYHCEMVDIHRGSINTCDFKIEYLDGELRDYYHRLNVIGKSQDNLYVFNDTSDGYPVVRILKLEEL